MPGDGNGSFIDVEDYDLLALDATIEPYARVQDSRVTKENTKKWKRNIPVKPEQLKGHFMNNTGYILNEQGALNEAQRCLKCADAPCQKSCPTQLNVKHFIGSIANGNFYGAAKQIMSDNPCGLSCGMVCPVSELCAGSCNIYDNPINIGGLQAYAVEVLKRMNLPQIRDPSLPPIDQLPESFKTKIAMIGCGPASISAATFLARLGYHNITIFEKNSYAGGLSAMEIPQTRLPTEVIAFEVQQMLDLGVKVQYDTHFGKDVTIDSLKKEGYQCFFLGFGLPDPKLHPLFKGLNADMGFYTSKSFLPKVNETVKSLCHCKETDFPKLYGRVVILGAGDTAMDCATSAVRAGADRVYVVFRRGFSGIRAVPEEYEIVLHEKAEFMPNCTPKEVIVRDGKIAAIELYKTDVVNGKVVKDDDQFIRLKADFVISAFGSTVNEQSIIDASSGVKYTDWGTIDVNEEMATNAAGVFAGGDLSGNGMTVEAVNDGKTASWGMHKYIQTQLHSTPVPKEPQLPKYYTPIDKVDVSVEMCGMKFLNPFGLASAPPATTIAMIARGFDAGWGFAVTKTYGMDKDSVTNVSPRIVHASTGGIGRYGPHQGSFLNIELISEKSAAYWTRGIAELKQRYPKHIVIGSIMSAFIEEDWKTLAIATEKSGADAIELNLSCPHGMGEKGMGLACGQDPNLVRQICAWVKEVVKIPVFAKLTPNVTNIVTIARAAQEGNADGVTATNTVSGLMHLRPDGTPWPSVGVRKRTTYGGMSGNAIRPIALKAVSAIAKALPGFPILATGGIDNADSGLQFLHAGASVLQVSSAIQNQDFTLIDDYVNGLKALQFINSHSEFANWTGQSAPVEKLKRTPGEGLPRFGDYLRKRRELETRDIETNGPLIKKVVNNGMNGVVDLSKETMVPSINDVVGKSVKHITAWHELDPKAEEHVIAVMDPETCINCGKCYLTCADTGYQAISFDAESHIPTIHEDLCTGCTLCASVCPVQNCIEMVPRPERVGKYNPKRGVEFGDF
mmetsp:Transcript_8520/g.12565  ORF Transcript_8520/g.12565 Transcript_8520/m.12565 type:complete len:1017 (+) Transcript_8520:16-3066(+)